MRDVIEVYLITEISHQKQALSFMLQREQGWQLDGRGKDIWSQGIDQNGQAV